MFILPKQSSKLEFFIACINTYLKLYLLKIVNIEDRVSNHETFKLLSETLIAHNRTFGNKI